MKKNNNKGFTLAELLIVVAIIAVLVAIAIPIFNTQLEKSREATDIANARDFYAEIAVGLVDGTLTEDATTHTATMKVTGGLDVTVTYASGIVSTVEVKGVTVNQKGYDNWASGSVEVGGVKLADADAPSAATDTTIKYTFTDGKYLSKVEWTAAA